MNIEHRTSNDEIASLRQFINWQNTLFKIRCWTFDVRCLVCLECCMISINSFLLAYISIYLVTFALNWTINRINLKHLEKYGKKVPDAFENMIDEKELQTINRYTLDNIRFQLVQSGFAKFFFLFSAFLKACACALRHLHNILQ